MSFFDWNQNGIDDIVDDFVEYNVYQDMMEEDSGIYSQGGGSCSGILIFLIGISGLIIQAILYTTLHIEIDDIPRIIMLILWIGIDCLVAKGASAVGILK